MSIVQVPCEECGKVHGTKLCYKLHPTNYARQERRLCSYHRTRLGYALVHGGRTAHPIGFRP